MLAKLFRILLAAALGASVLGAQIEYDSAKQIWSLRSGPVEYRLRQQEGLVVVAYLGPTGRAVWPAPIGRAPGSRYDIAGLVDGQNLLPQDLTLASHEIRQPRPGCTALRLLYKHRRLPLEVEAIYTAWGDTGVFTRQLTYTNHGSRPLPMESAPSLAWRLPPGEYNLDYLHGLWGEERQLLSEKITPGRRAFVNTNGRSTDGYSPWFSLRNEALGVRYAAQLACSGNWAMSFERSLQRTSARWSDRDLLVDLGMRFDFGGAAPLAPGASFRLPAVAFTASAGDLDDVANQLHRYQRQYVIARTPTNDPILAQFNTWYPFLRDVNAEQVKQYADRAAELGLEAVVIDSGWFSNRGSRPNPIFGDWEPDPVTFPKGLRDVADYVHAKGMKFGVWVEIECAATDSRVIRDHPDWVLRYNGVAIPGQVGRVYLNFAKPEVRRWARAVIDRLVGGDRVDWLKFDYNVDVGEDFDSPSSPRSGTVLHDHLRNYAGFLDQLRADYPNLVIENCASGGLRFDLDIIAHTHTTWVSDVVEPRRSVQLAYGCTVEFTPEVCNHWMVGDKENGSVDTAASPGWWDFMFRVPMNGQFGISSRLAEWTPELKKRAIENVALYKRVRPVITGADVYHLTPPPAAGANPVGWMALQYNSGDCNRSVVMAYRLGRSEPQQVFRLRGLDPEQRYRVTSEGRPAGVLTGRQLASQGLPIKLEAEWRAAVIELEMEQR